MQHEMKRRKKKYDAENDFRAEFITQRNSISNEIRFFFGRRNGFDLVTNGHRFSGADTNSLN